MGGIGSTDGSSGGMNEVGITREALDLPEWRQYSYAQPYMAWEGEGHEKKEKEAVKGRRHIW